MGHNGKFIFGRGLLRSYQIKIQICEEIYKKYKADYGIDAPGVIRNFYIFGAILCFMGWFIPTFTLLGYQITFVGSFFIWWGGSWIASSTFMILYAKKGKFRHRDRILNMVLGPVAKLCLMSGPGADSS